MVVSYALAAEVVSGRGVGVVISLYAVDPCGVPDDALQLLGCARLVATANAVDEAAQRRTRVKLAASDIVEHRADVAGLDGDRR